MKKNKWYKVGEIEPIATATYIVCIRGICETYIYDIAQGSDFQHLMGLVAFRELETYDE